MHPEPSGRVPHREQTVPWARARALVRRMEENSKGHIPLWDFLDYAMGGYDDPIMTGLHRAHLEGCERCSRELARMKQLQPPDLLSLSLVPEFAAAEIETLEYSLKDGTARTHIVDFVTKEQGPLVVVGGEGNPYVYGEEFAEAIRRRSVIEAREGWKKPQMFFGPALMKFEGKKNEEVVPLRLASEGLVDLHISDRRQSVHYRNANDSVVAVEGYHQAGNADELRRAVVYRSAPVGALFARRTAALLRAKMVRPAAPEDFVVISENQMRKLHETTGYDGLDSRGLRELATRL